MYKLAIIDDEYYNHLLLNDILEEYPEELEIFSAEFGDQGLDLVFKEKPDIVFLDRVLPIIGGLEICKTIKEKPELREVKVVIVSALKVSHDKDGFIADAYLQKPYNSQDISALLDELLPGKR